MNEQLIQRMKKTKTKQYQLAEHLGITRQTLSRKIKTGKLTQIEVQVIEEYLKTKEEVKNENTSDNSNQHTSDS